MNENFGYSQTQVVIDGERYDKLTVFAEQYEAISFASFFKGILVGFTFTMVLSLFINHL